ncbi:MAG: cation diffusion facilitator family transporter [Sphingomonadales bacterium]|nr:cation diffusion facilitator family transporter [Sphingomonadales bacterium]
MNQRAAIASVTTALFLLGLKAWAAWTTGSVAMLGSLADTALDVFASLVTLYVVRHAAMPADEDHRFGHGKAEALGALFQVTLISLSAIGIGWRVIDRLLNGEVTAQAELGIGVSVVAIAVTLALLAYQRAIIANTGSVAIEADHVHYQSDLLLNLGVIVALVLDQLLGLRGADPAIGILIAAWLAYGAWRASSRAIDQLMDKEWPEEKRLRFVEIASRFPELENLHDLRTRTSGHNDFVQFHVWMDPDLSVREAHDIVERVEEEMAREFPGTEVLIHIDPAGHIDEPDNPMVEADEMEKLEGGNP